MNAWKTPCHAVRCRADTVHTDYLKKLHDIDRAAGTPFARALLASGKCALSDNHLEHGEGGGELHLINNFPLVRPLVFGHFGEFNDGLLTLADDISKSVAYQHHRMLGFKSENAGLSRVKAGVMRRLSMAALRCTARHVLRGLAIVAPPCIHQYNAREAERHAHHDSKPTMLELENAHLTLDPARCNEDALHIALAQVCVRFGGSRRRHHWFCRGGALG